MSREKPEELKYEFMTRPGGERFSVSDDVLDAYRRVVKLVHPKGKLTYVPTEGDINEAKNELLGKFLAENEGTGMPVDELLQNLDRLAAPL